MTILAKIARVIESPKVMEQCFLATDASVQAWMDAPENRSLLFTLCERCSQETNEKLARMAVSRLSSKLHVDSGTEACLLGSRRDYEFVLPQILSAIKQEPQLASEDCFLRIYASALNKCPAAMVQDPESAQRIYDAADGITAQQSAKLMGRAFKALTLRSSVQPAEKLGKFLQSLLHSDDEQVALEASAAFGNLVLLQGVDDGLDVPFTRCLGVARQRAFERWFRVLTEDMATSSKSSEALLGACASLAAGAPQSILMESIKEVIPIMIRASKSERLETRVAGLRILKTIIDDATDTIEAYLSTLIPFLLKFLTGPTKARDPVDRLDALAVLECLPSYLPYHKLHPHRSTISSALAKGALDDTKRSVRQKAVECRERWAMFTAS